MRPTVHRLRCLRCRATFILTLYVRRLVKSPCPFCNHDRTREVR